MKSSKPLIVISLLFLVVSISSFTGTRQQPNPWKRNYGQIKISPEENVSKIIHVDLGTIEAEEYVIEIESKAGTKLFEKHFKDKSFNVVVEDLAAGSYLLKIVTSRYVYTKSFTKA